MQIVLIQRAHDTGRFHPAFYNERPLPGPMMPGRTRRYKSGGHHTQGFETEQEAQASAAETFDQLDLTIGEKPERFEVVEVAEAGPHIVFMEGSAAVTV